MTGGSFWPNAMCHDVRGAVGPLSASVSEPARCLLTEHEQRCADRIAEPGSGPFADIDPQCWAQGKSRADCTGKTLVNRRPFRL